jgi:hypothetical protein
MMRIRAHVRLVAAVWLSCQVAAFAASPFVLCHDHGVMPTADGHECDKTHHHHGQPAATPAGHDHHHSTASQNPASDNASLNCRCTISDAALAALTLDAGILPGTFAIETNVATTRVVLHDYAAPTRSHIPDIPPPRA